MPENFVLVFVGKPWDYHQYKEHIDKYPNIRWAFSQIWLITLLNESSQLAKIVMINKQVR